MHPRRSRLGDQEQTMSWARHHQVEYLGQIYKTEWEPINYNKSKKEHQKMDSKKESTAKSTCMRRRLSRYRSASPISNGSPT